MPIKQLYSWKLHLAIAFFFIYFKQAAEPVSFFSLFTLFLSQQSGRPECRMDAFLCTSRDWWPAVSMPPTGPLKVLIHTHTCCLCRFEVLPRSGFQMISVRFIKLILAILREISTSDREGCRKINMHLSFPSLGYLTCKVICLFRSLHLTKTMLREKKSILAHLFFSQTQ